MKLRRRAMMRRHEGKLVLGGLFAFTAFLITFISLSGCVSEGVVVPPPVKGSANARATEVCTRKMAQLAATYHAKDVTAFLVEDAQLLDDGRSVITLMVLVRYPNESRKASVACTVNSRGYVVSVEEA